MTLGEVPTLFGMPIDQLLLNSSGVPIFLPMVCNYITQFSETVGLFRRSGSHRLVQELGVIFNLPECAIPPCASVHDMASFLKQWLRDLPDPLISPDILNEMYDVSSEDSVGDVLSSLPDPNRKCLAIISNTLIAVLRKESVNQMGYGNLNTCFAGSLCQNQKGLRKAMPVMKFLESCHAKLNAEKTDFDL
jgi:hypothetical protein